MAEGGYDRPETPEEGWFDWARKKNPNGNDDDEQEGNRTYEFQPVRASTPYHGSEQIEMQMMHDEQTGMEETSYVETPLLQQIIDHEEKQSQLNGAFDFIKRRLPKVDFKKLGPIGFSKKGAQGDIVSFGPKGGETQIFKKDGSGLLKSFTDKFSKSLGQARNKL